MPRAVPTVWALPSLSVPQAALTILRLPIVVLLGLVPAGESVEEPPADVVQDRVVVAGVPEAEPAFVAPGQALDLAGAARRVRAGVGRRRVRVLVLARGQQF